MSVQASGDIPLRCDRAITGGLFSSSPPVRHRSQTTPYVPTIPSTAARKQRTPLDRHCYLKRTVIERMFCRWKDFRRIATRYDKLARNSSLVSVWRQQYPID